MERRGLPSRQAPHLPTRPPDKPSVVLRLFRFLLGLALLTAHLAPRRRRKALVREELLLAFREDEFLATVPLFALQCLVTHNRVTFRLLLIRIPNVATVVATLSVQSHNRDEGICRKPLRRRRCFRKLRGFRALHNDHHEVVLPSSLHPVSLGFSLQARAQYYHGVDRQAIKNRTREHAPAQPQPFEPAYP